MDGAPKNSGSEIEPGPESLTDRVRAVLDLIRPAIKEDGGDIELVSVSPEGAVEIRFLGACIGCPSSEVTLRDGIAQNLQERIPEVQKVVAVD